MPSRLNYPPYDVTDAFVSVLDPRDENYDMDALTYGVDEPTGQFIVGIGADNPDVVITGTREHLIEIATQIQTKLGG